MKRLHIFNPSHDEALAANSAHYYPAHAARTLEADLGSLPMWWAKPGDAILLPDAINLPVAIQQAHEVEFLHLSNLETKGKDFEKICPWGWNPLIAYQLLKAGIPQQLVPGNETLEITRQLSSRHSAVKLLKKIREDYPATIGESTWCTSEAEVWNYVTSFPKCMLKAPWSSSGRGVFPAESHSPENIHQRVARILKTQGAVEVEPFYQRIQDFAVEFEATEQHVHYSGLSVFATTGTGAYCGNIVAQDDVLGKHLPHSVYSLLKDIIPCLEMHLEQMLLPYYQGPLGIDMMCVATPEGPSLHPCIEINLRNTMGHVAIALRSQLSHHQEAIYSIRPKAAPQKDCLLLTPNAQKMEAVLHFSMV